VDTRPLVVHLHDINRSSLCTFVVYDITTTRYCLSAIADYVIYIGPHAQCVIDLTTARDGDISQLPAYTFIITRC